MSIFKFQIGERFPEAIQTGEWSQLNGKEIQCLEDFLDDLPAAGSWEFADSGHYAQCSIMQEVGWCYAGEFSPAWAEEDA